MKKLIILLAFVSFACSNDDDADTRNCTEVYTAGLIVTVNDGAIPVPGATVTATDEEYIEELVYDDTTQMYYGAYEREGTYTLTVTAEGYQPYSSESITIDADECHVITEEVTVSLQPE